MITYSKQVPNQTQLVNLYASVGWLAYTKDANSLVQAVSHSVFISAWQENTLIGLIRGVTDQHSILFVQDLLVLPEVQRHGIGKRLMEELVKAYPTGQLVLITDDEPATKAFYQKIGLLDTRQNHICAFFKDTRWS
ncbi:GNAT family N-acetyltransferase [Pediococcus cellicola]|uniref:N-acetyltransferase domain-containing protein n=1 Tax=Pediococcus cellicola TaxID=319652 RepID=A0A0R2INR7_9LACO|nr:GNAT family N-acetyltransferase [Pediococcus cellicola]KRN66802.1 hypothetical protein IV80_GL001395 [Pediococcus cellicola]GEL14553.1 N-acetyltransferase [Pediococcus cellicola]